MINTSSYIKYIINTPYVASKLDELEQDDEFYYLYKHTSVDEKKLVFNIFKNCHLKFTKPISFNDPYDSHFDIRVNFSGLTRKKFNTEHNYKIREHEWEIEKERYKEKLTNILKTEALKDFRNIFTVACFNNNPLNILMWSHYANNHEGFLIEFKFPKNDITRLPMPVEYSSNYPTVLLPYSMMLYRKDIKLQYENLRKSFFVKSEDWIYENEYRLINTSSELSEFRADCISSIIFGTNTPLSIKNNIREIINDFNLKHNLEVKIYQTQLAKREYKLIVSGHPRLDKK